MTTKTKNRRGFTLIEIIVSLTVLCMLAGIVIGMASHSTESSRRARAAADIAAIENAVERYRDAFGDYPAPKTNKASDDGAAYYQDAVTNFWNATRRPCDVEESGDADAPSKSRYFMTLHSFLPDDFTAVDPWGDAYIYTFSPESPESFSVTSPTLENSHE